MSLSDFLTTIAFEIGEQTLVAVDPQTRFAVMAGENGPERVDSAHRKVLVPVFDWRAKQLSEDEEIIKVLVEASASNPLKVPSPAALDMGFWVKHRGWKALLCNPGILGKFVIPDGPEVVASENVGLTEMVLVGPASVAGFYVRQGDRRGVITNSIHGLSQIQFFTV